MEDCGRHSPDASAVYAAVTGHHDEFYNRTSCPSSSRSQFSVISTGTANGIPASRSGGVSPQVRDKVQMPEEGPLGIPRTKCKRLAQAREAAAQPSGWFWGDGGCSAGRGNIAEQYGGDTNRGVAAPGEGAMGAFWRETTALGKDAPKNGGNVAPRDAVAGGGAAAGAHQFSSPRTPPAGGNTTTGRPPDSGHIPPKGTSEISGNVISKASVSVASTKAAVRSASNRVAKLSHLLSEGNKPPREECLAKAEAAVRAAQSAVSCANERLFQLELTATPSASSTHAVERSGNTKACRNLSDERAVCFDVDVTVGDPAKSRDSYAMHDTCGTNSSPCSPSFTAHISQLSEQLKLAQSLQAASLTARARLTKRFALEDAAAVRLQALARGIDVRRQERFKEARRAKTANIESKRAQSPALAKAVAEEDRTKDSGRSSYGSSLSRWADAVNLPSSRGSSFRATEPQKNCPCDSGDPRGKDGEGTSKMAPLPRKEELWWTLAEVESADEIGESESVLLIAVVKLQAIVRSRLARSKTFGAVNARFVEHFDGEHQHPFYVCSETKSSQWTRPFGFGFTRKANDSTLSPFRAGGGSNKRDGVALESTLSDNCPRDAEEGSPTAPVYDTSRTAPAEENVAENVVLVVKEVLANEMGASGRVLLDAVEKLQALVRSRLSRSKTIAAVNARFVEHFDEEYQCAFYVCAETNVSQWNRPFGFGFRRRKQHDLPSSLHCDDVGMSPSPGDTVVAGGGCNFGGDAHATSVATNKGGEAEREPCGTPTEEAAAVVIQCAARAAQAREQWAENILLASL